MRSHYKGTMIASIAFQMFHSHNYDAKPPANVLSAHLSSFFYTTRTTVLQFWPDSRMRRRTYYSALCFISFQNEPWQTTLIANTTFKARWHFALYLKWCHWRTVSLKGNLRVLPGSYYWAIDAFLFSLQFLSSWEPGWWCLSVHNVLYAFEWGYAK